MDSMITTEFCGCGKCLVGVRRLSRQTDATSSPERQLNQILAVVESIGAHIIGWADDWEVSGAINPRNRPAFGPWLRDEMGPYAGIVGATVDRIGRNMRDTLNTGWEMHESGRLLVTANHGIWDLSDPTEENLFTAEAWGAQMELRSIQKRIRDEAARALKAGEPKQKPPYGYQYVRLVPAGKVDHVAINPGAAEVIRDVAERILSDESGTITVVTEAARLTREGVLSPGDTLAKLYGRPTTGGMWTPKSLKLILTSEASLGYQMHHGRPVLGADGRPVRLADPLWDRATHDALVKATAPKRSASRAPKGVHLLSGLAYCATCGQKLYMAGGTTDGDTNYTCMGRTRGIIASQQCKPSPTIPRKQLNEYVSTWFLAKYGAMPVFRKEFDPGTGSAARIAELTADRERLREDREAGLYNAADDAEWYRNRYTSMGEELAALKAQPERPAGMYWVATGQTVADQWNAARDDAARRETLTAYEVRAVVSYRGSGQPRVWVHGLDATAETDARQAVWEAYEEDLRNRGEYEEWLERHRADAAHDQEEYVRWTAENPDAPVVPTSHADDEDAPDLIND